MEGMTGLVAKMNGPWQLIGFALLLMAFLLWRSKSSPTLWKKTWPWLLVLAVVGSFALGGWQMWLSAQVELNKNANSAVPSVGQAASAVHNPASTPTPTPTPTPNANPAPSPAPSSSVPRPPQNAKVRDVKDQGKVEIEQSSPHSSSGQSAEVSGVSGSASVTIKQGAGNGK